MPEQTPFSPESHEDAERHVAAKATLRKRGQAEKLRGRLGEFPEDSTEAAVLRLRAERKEQEIQRLGEEAVRDYRLSREAIAEKFPEVAGMPEAEADALLYEKYLNLMSELDIQPDQIRSLEKLKRTRRYDKYANTDWEKVLDIVARGLSPGMEVLYHGPVSKEMRGRIGGFNEDRAVIKGITPNGHITIEGSMVRGKDGGFNPFDFDIIADASPPDEHR